jgi:hypothetical protein
MQDVSATAPDFSRYRAHRFIAAPRQPRLEQFLIARSQLGRDKQIAETFSNSFLTGIECGNLFAPFGGLDLLRKRH